MKKNNETPSQRFKRIATKRVNTILNKLDILGNCANKQYYEYSDKDVKTIFRAIDNKLKEVKIKFKSSNKSEFIL